MEAPRASLYNFSAIALEAFFIDFTADLRFSNT